MEIKNDKISDRKAFDWGNMSRQILWDLGTGVPPGNMFRYGAGF